VTYLTVRQAGAAYPALGERYLRRLISGRRIAFHRVGRKVLLRSDDIEAFIGSGRVEPVPSSRRRVAYMAANAGPCKAGAASTNGGTISDAERLPA
jgi:excisionase family DNA binding protein